MDQSSFTIGVDFGGTKMLAVALDASGVVLSERRVLTPYEPSELFDAIAEEVVAIEENLGRASAGIGVGAAGLVDLNGHYHFGPNVGGVRELSVIASLSERLGPRNIRVDNDNTCATWAEFKLGAARDRAEAVFVGLGTGIGGGIITSGDLSRGHNGFAGEFGHMTVVADGVECVCGKNGCWEAYASGRALGRFGREAAARENFPFLIELAGGIEQIRGEHVTAAARAGDETAIDLMEEFSRWLAIGIANLIAILDPELVVVGGGLAADADLYFPKTHEMISSFVFGAESRPHVPVVRAALGPQSAAIGAALLSWDQSIQ